MKIVITVIFSLLLMSNCKSKKKNDEESSDAGGAVASISNQGGDDTSNDDTADITDNNTPLNLTAPTNFSDGETYDPANDSYSLTWSSVSGASSYEIAVGTSEGATDILDWQDIGNNTSVSTQSFTLPDAGMFYASIRAVASDGTKGAIASGDGWQHLVCPTHWIRVKGDTTPGLGGSTYVNGTRTRHDSSTRTLSDFCVMKYEMKLHDGTSIVTDGDVDSSGFNVNYFSPGAENAVSDPSGKPWVRIKRKSAGDNLDTERACTNISGTGLVTASLDSHFYLINNAQWQAIARDITTVATNWNDVSAGTENSDFMNRGWTGDSNSNSPGSLAADPDDANGCASIALDPDHSLSATCDDSWNVLRRTHYLSNGEVIWDFSGNVREWVIDDADPVNDASGDGYVGSDDYISQDPYNDDVEGPAGANKLMFGPEGDHTGKSSGDRGNFGWMSDLNTGGPIFRSAYWVSGDNGGVFATTITSSIAVSNTALTGRCVWAP